LEIGYSWAGISPLTMVLIALFFGVFVFIKVYAKRKRRVKPQIKAYGYFFLVLAALWLVGSFAAGVSIANPSMVLLVSLAVATVVLVYLDGWMTQKAVGGGMAVEANPLMGWLFRLFGFKTVRVLVLAAVGALLFKFVGERDLMVVGMAFFLWVFVDGNNILALRGIRKRQRLMALVLGDEIGFEDIHEL
jgi:hypothetical protein